MRKILFNKIAMNVENKIKYLTVFMQYRYTHMYAKESFVTALNKR